jgi:GNAT superfamily N-acetyltransferase
MLVSVLPNDTICTAPSSIQNKTTNLLTNYTLPKDLQILVTTPAHRRRGAASQLIEWGTQRADERGLKSVLMASEAGLGAYLKHGFKVVPYGVEATELRRWMVREPVPVPVPVLGS